MDVSDISYFVCSWTGKGESEARGGGGGPIFIGNPKRGVFRRERGRGAGRVSAANWGIGGGGLNIFLGAEMSTKYVCCAQKSP